MSFEPHIIVEQIDLQNKRDKILEDSFSNNEKLAEVATFLNTILNSEPIILKNMRLYIFQPEFTSFNSKVRKYLYDAKIEFTIDN